MQKFSDYFCDWLYGNNGYYSKLGQVGASGDFVTSVTTSSFFAASVANYFLRRLKGGFFNEEEVWFVELGSNRGLAIKDAIRYIASIEPELLKKLKFCAIEPLENTRAQLKQELDGFDFGQDRLVVAKNISEINAKEAFIFANEVLDCMPCELLFEENFAFVEDGKILWAHKNEELLDFAKQYGILKGEVPMGVDEFAKSFAIDKCEVLFFDYGQGYARNDFSIRVYQNHETHPLFLIDNLDDYFAKSDITYDVNFEIYKDAFCKQGFEARALISQARALVEFGIDEIIRLMLEKVDVKTANEQLRRIKLLLAPEAFGERFKMLCLIKS